MELHIDLTDSELRAVATAVWSPLPTHPEDEQDCLDTVREVIDALNRVRVGDPVGTVRRHPSGNAVALRVAQKPSPHDRNDVHWWRILNPDSMSVYHGGQIVVQDWPVIYSPEES